MTKITTQTAAAPVAPPIEEIDKTLNAMDQFMAPTNEIRATKDNFTADELAPIKTRLSERIIEEDAISGIDKGQALHRMLTGVNKDEAKSQIDVDLQGMHASILGNQDWSEMEKAKYRRAIGVLDDAKAKGLNIMKSDSGRYWFESTETGESVYVANGIVEVKELLDKYYDPDGTIEKQQRKNEGIIDEDTEITPENASIAVSDSDTWMMRGLGTDLVTSIGALGMKLSGVGAGVGVGVGIAGGLSAAAMTMYSDYLSDDVTRGEMWKNLGVRLGLEALETVTVLPASTLSMFKGASRAGKVIRRGLQVAMIGGTIDAATHADWNALWDKDMSDWGVNEYKSAAAMAQFLIGFGGASAMRGKAKKGLSADLKQTLKPKGSTLRADARADLGLAAKPKAKIGDAKAVGKTGEIAKTKATLVAKTKTKAGEVAVKREGRVIEKGIKRNADIETSGTAKIKSINKKANAQRRLIKKGTPAKKAAYKVNESGEIIKGENPKQLKLDFDNTSAKTKAKIDAVNKKARLDRKNAKAATKTELDNSNKLVAKKKEVIAKAKGKSEKARVDEHIKKEKAEVNKLVSKKKSDANKKIVKKKESAAAKKQDILDAHGQVIGKRLIKRSENKALGKSRAEAYRRRAKAETKQQKKQLTDVDRLKKEREALNKKIEKTTAAENRGPNKRESASLTKKSDEIKAAEARAKSYKGKADKMLAKAKKVKEEGTGIGKKILRAGATPINALVARNNLSPAVKSIHANEMFISGRKPAPIGTVKKFLTDNGKSIQDKSDVELRAMAKKVAEKNRGKVETKQTGGRLIRKFQVSGVLPVEKGAIDRDSYISMGTANLLSKFKARTLVKNDDSEFDNIIKPATGITLDPTAFNKFKRLKDGLPAQTDLDIVAPAKITDPKMFELKNLLKVRDNTYVAPVQKGTLAGGVNNVANVLTDTETAKILTDTQQAAIIIANKAITQTPEKKAEIIAEYNKIIADAQKLATTKPNGWKAALGMLQNVRISDFMSTNKIHIERPNAEDLQSTVLHSRGIRNMHGLNAAKNRTRLIPRVDTADSFAANMMQKTFFNEGEKRRGELVAKNAQFIEKSRDEDSAIKNQNIASAAQINNMNITRRNEANRQFAASKVQAEAQKQTLDNKKRGRIADGLVKGLTTGYRKAQRTKLNTDYNSAVALKSRWNTEFKPRFDKAVTEGNNLESTKIKSEFTTATKFNVDDLDKYMLDTKAKYDNIL